MNKQPETLKNLCEQAVQSHPKKFFTVEDIVAAVTELRPEAKPGSIRTCIQRDLKGAKMIHVAKREGTKNTYALGDGNGNAIVTKRRRRKIMKDKQTDEVFPFEADKAPDTAPDKPQENSSDADDSDNKIEAKAKDNRLTFDSYQIGESIIAYIASIRQQIVSYRIKITDLEVKLKNEKRQSLEALREKDNVIETLNQRIKALNNIKRSMGKGNTVSFKMDEVARVTASNL